MFSSFAVASLLVSPMAAMAISRAFGWSSWWK